MCLHDREVWGLGPFNLVAFLISFGPIVPFAAELPLGSIYVGSTGALCLPSIDVGAVAMTDIFGYADICYPLPPSALGLSLTHQAVVITGVFHAGPCDHQQM